MDYSPFSIPHEQLQTLLESPSFQLLRECLSGCSSFCSEHSQGDQQAKETWLMHRDILHALIMPIVELFKRASTLAEAALCATEDLETAFSGDARGAFVWLQCFLTEEPNWCQTKGCPACVTIETLSTEHHIRLAIAASLVSTSEGSSSMRSDGSTPPDEDVRSGTNETSTMVLPPLPQILPALRSALDHDAFWGPEYWTYLFGKAVVLSTGIRALIASCVDLEALVMSPAPTSSTVAKSVSYHVYLRNNEEKGARLKKSKLAKRQLRMRGEEMEIMRRCALQCWAKVAMSNRMRNRLLDREERTRRLTCP